VPVDARLGEVGTMKLIRHETHARPHPRRLALLTALAVSAVVAVMVPAPGSATTGTPLLVGIRAAAHPTYDRVVFDFTGRGPTSVSVAWVSQLTGDFSGLPVPIAGRAFLRVVLQGVAAHDDAVPTAPAKISFALKNVITAVSAGDSEGVVTYGIGLAARTSYTTMRLTSPTRFVIDISTSSLSTVGRSVYFVDNRKVRDNTEPPVTAVWRPVLAMTPATGVMDRLYAGPTPAEKAAGLTFVASESTGFTRLSISAMVARVQLTGGCDSGGSAVATVATQIFPSLRQFSTVDWVKIYDPDGRTGSPTGRQDSIPDCLNP
jgi:hypothetical protein